MESEPRPLLFESVFSIFAETARRHPDRPYLIGGAVHTYGATYARITRVARGIARINPHGKAVLLHLSCQEKLALCFWACALLGHDVVLLPGVAPGAVMRNFPDPAHVGPVVADDESLFAASAGAQPGSDPPAAAAHKVPRTVKVYFFSSGTTGEPKLIVNTHGQILRAIACIRATDPMPYLHTCSTVYITPPLFHSYGLSALLEYTSAGASIVLPQQQSLIGPVKTLFNGKMAAIIDSIEGVPYFFSQLLPLLPRIALPALKHIGFGGDFVESQLIGKLHEKFPGACYSIRYGITEVPSVISIQAFSFSEEIQTNQIKSWLPIYQVSLAGASAAGEEEASGEVCVTFETDADGLCTVSTGDMAASTGSGFVLEGRKNTFVKHKGFKISLIRIERAVREAEGVLDAKVYLSNQRLLAEVIVSSPAVVSSVKEYLAGKLPGYMLPDAFKVVKEIVRTKSGKIVRIPA